MCKWCYNIYFTLIEWKTTYNFMCIKSIPVARCDTLFIYVCSGLRNKSMIFLIKLRTFKKYPTQCNTTPFAQCNRMPFAQCNIMPFAQCNITPFAHCNICMSISIGSISSIMKLQLWHVWQLQVYLKQMKWVFHVLWPWPYKWRLYIPDTCLLWP